MRYIISGGGTGGHIYPALTIAEALQKLDKSAQILFVGTADGLESDIVPKAGYSLQVISVHGFERRLSLQNVKNIFVAINSLRQARKILNTFKPDVVIGTGGYVCGPVLFMASMMGIPSLIQEQNAIPGFTNRILSWVVDKVAAGYEESVRYFHDAAKVIVTGNPVRADVMQATKSEAIESLGLKTGRKNILVSGGSRGAHTINMAMLTVCQHFAACEDIQILHITGKSEYNVIVDALAQQGIAIDKTGNITIKSYLYNMPQALAVADMVVFRAGAIGLAEITARGLPAILVPYPYAAENHQELNAKVLEKKGAAKIILDKDLQGETLVFCIESLLQNPDKLAAMAEASKNLGRPDAAKRIADLAFNMVN